MLDLLCGQIVACVTIVLYAFHRIPGGLEDKGGHFVVALKESGSGKS